MAKWLTIASTVFGHIIGSRSGQILSDTDREQRSMLARKLNEVGVGCIGQQKRLHLIPWLASLMELVRVIRH